MATSRRTDKGGDPVKAGSPDQGRPQAARVARNTANGSHPDESRQPGSYESPWREIFNFCRWAAKDQEAQQGLDRLWRSFARNILWPVCFSCVLIAVALTLFESISAPLAAKIGVPSVVAACVAVAAWFKGGRKKHRGKSVNEDSETAPEDND